MACVIDVSQLVAYTIMAVGGDMTLETNSGGAADDTIVLTDGVPVQWDNADTTFNPVPFTADITALYMTNASGGASVLKAIFIIDPTV